MGTESISPEIMKDILKTEHGIIFFPKRPLEIPKLSEEKILSLFGEENREHVAFYIDVLLNFLHGTPIGDEWGKNHDDRRRWCNTMFQKYGSVFTGLYEDGNQFRVNVLSVVSTSRQILSMLAEETGSDDLVKSLAQIAKETGTELKKYPDYRELESHEEKLEIVHLYEDEALKILQLLT